MNKIDWLVKQDEVKESIGVEIWNTLLLTDHPYYKALFDKCNMGCRTSIYTRSSIVKATFGKIFNPTPEFFMSGTLGKHICDQTGVLYTPLADSIGNMRRFGAEGDQYCIAFECIDSKLNLVDIFTVLYEYGHYVEQRVAQDLGVAPGKLKIRKTSFYPAILIHGYCDNLNQAIKNEILCKGDKLAAYLNAYWLAWLFNIDLRNWLSGMVMDEITSTGGMDSFVRDVWLEFGDYILDRELADKLFLSCGEYSLDCLNLNENIEELNFCKQIDKASYVLLINILEYIDRETLQKELGRSGKFS